MYFCQSCVKILPSRIRLGQKKTCFMFRNAVNGVFPIKKNVQSIKSSILEFFPVKLPGFFSLKEKMKFLFSFLHYYNLFPIFLSFLSFVSHRVTFSCVEFRHKFCFAFSIQYKSECLTLLD